MQKIADQKSERYVGWPTRLRFIPVIEFLNVKVSVKAAKLALQLRTAVHEEAVTPSDARARDRRKTRDEC